MTVQLKRGQMMADIRNTSNKDSAVTAGLAKSVRTFGGEIKVVVSGGRMFDYYIRKLYRAMAYAHISSTMTDGLPFGEDEFVFYCYDALHVRVQRVLREPSPLPFQGWALPAPFATMLAALGEVTHEAPYVRIVPAWPSDRPWFLTRSTWNELTMRIKSVEASMNILLVDTIERDPKGRDDLMSLIPQALPTVEDSEIALSAGVDTLSENLAGIEAVYGREPVDAISAATYLALGMYPEGDVDPSLVHPLLRPGYKIDYDPAMLVVERLTQVKSA